MNSEVKVAEPVKAQNEFNLLILWHNGTTRHRRVVAESYELAVKQLTDHYLLRHVPQHFAIGTDAEPPVRPVRYIAPRKVKVAEPEQVVKVPELVTDSDIELVAELKKANGLKAKGKPAKRQKFDNKGKQVA